MAKTRAVRPLLLTTKGSPISLGVRAAVPERPPEWLEAADFCRSHAGRPHIQPGSCDTEPDV